MGKGVAFPRKKNDAYVGHGGQGEIRILLKCKYNIKSTYRKFSLDLFSFLVLATEVQCCFSDWAWLYLSTSFPKMYA